ncbi:hypothetical protein HGRIS_007698 [Hohenbuehelia grisea]|uniref:Uncharacterized protein n=1 Tax=Hohenbuehelia grisea TaxID=104357 RepID=A0ABR3J610_9AGAR
MEPPHPCFWIEASADMPRVLKRRCIEAFQKIHAQGVLHGDVEVRHMLIGADARVTIIDFQASRALVPNEAVELKQASPEDLRMEMRKVKFKLDYEDSRAVEMRRRARYLERREMGQPWVSDEDILDPPVPDTEWTDSWLEPGDYEPQRFVMPGQTTAQVDEAVERFIYIVDQLVKEDASVAASTLTPPSTPPRDLGSSLSTDAPISVDASTPLPSSSDSPQIDGTTHGYHLRKRKPATPHPDAAPMPKRRRYGEKKASTSKGSPSRKLSAATSSHVSTSAHEQPRIYSTGGSSSDASLQAGITPPMASDVTSPSSPSPNRRSHLNLNPEVSNPVSESRSSTTHGKTRSVDVPGDATLTLPADELLPPSDRQAPSTEYSKLVALAAKKEIPRFSPRSGSSSLSTAVGRSTAEPGDLLPAVEARDDEISPGKRKRSNEDLDTPSRKLRRTGSKGIKWSDRPIIRRSNSGPPLRIRSILKKYNPPAIRLHELRRIAESAVESEPGTPSDQGGVSVGDLDRINDGSRDLDEELRDDLDMSIDAADSDENFLSGYARVSAPSPSPPHDSSDTRGRADSESSSAASAHGASEGPSPPLTPGKAAFTSANISLEASQAPQSRRDVEVAHGGLEVIFSEAPSASEDRQTDQGAVEEPPRKGPLAVEPDNTSPDSDEALSRLENPHRPPITNSLRRWLGALLRFYH